MAAQEWSFVGPKAHRSAQIAPKIWERHKAELKDLYETRSLEEVMLHMKTTRKFSPSKRQYIYQFDKWGFSKYNKSTDETSHIKDSKALVTDSKATLKTSDHEDPASSPVELVSLAVKRKTGEFERSDKRRKVYLTVINSNGENSTSISETPVSQSSTPKLDPKSHESRRPNSLQEKETLEHATSDAFAGEEHEVRTSEVGQQFCRLNPSTNTFHWSLTHLLQLDDSTDLAHVLRNLSLYEMEKIFVAADFLAASQCQCEAFLLYFILLERHQDIPRQTVECALIGCTRNAILPWQISTMKIVLDHYLAALQSDPLTKTALQRVIYIQLIEEIEDKSKFVHRATRPSSITAETHWPISSLSLAPDDAKPLVLERAYQSNMNARPVFSIPQETLWLHTIEIAAISGTVRQFLDWCRYALTVHKNIVQILSDWAFADPRRECYISVYHGLLQAFLADARDDLRAHLLQWADLSKTELGLSSARFLANVALMLSSRTGVTYYMSDVTKKPEHRNLDQLAISACDRLLTASDDYLASEFLSQHYIISSGTLGISDFSNSQDVEDRICGLIKEQAKTLLQIQVPHPHRIKSFWDTRQLLAFCLRRDGPEDVEPAPEKSNVPDGLLPDRVPTLAESLHSSEYLGLKATGYRYHEAPRREYGSREAPSSGSEISRSLYSRMTRESWRLSRYVPDGRSAASAADIENITTGWSSMSINTNSRYHEIRKNSSRGEYWDERTPEYDRDLTRGDYRTKAMNSSKWN